MATNEEDIIEPVGETERINPKFAEPTLPFGNNDIQDNPVNNLIVEGEIIQDNDFVKQDKKVTLDIFLDFQENENICAKFDDSVKSYSMCICHLEKVKPTKKRSKTEKLGDLFSGNADKLDWDELETQLKTILNHLEKGLRLMTNLGQQQINLREKMNTLEKFEHKILEATNLSKLTPSKISDHVIKSLKDAGKYIPVLTTLAGLGIVGSTASITIAGILSTVVINVAIFTTILSTLGTIGLSPLVPCAVVAGAAVFGAGVISGGAIVLGMWLYQARKLGKERAVTFDEFVELKKELDENCPTIIGKLNSTITKLKGLVDSLVTANKSLSSEFTIMRESINSAIVKTRSLSVDSKNESTRLREKDYFEELCDSYVQWYEEMIEMLSKNNHELNEEEMEITARKTARSCVAFKMSKAELTVKFHIDDIETTSCERIYIKNNQLDNFQL